MGGRTVLFAVGGREFTTTTDVTGAAVASPALPPGGGLVTVSFAGDDLYAPSQAPATLVVTASAGAVTGGVTVGAGHGGFNAQSDGVTVRGELQFADFHAHEVTALGISGSRAWFAGAGDDGRPFVAYVQDAGEPGTADVFRLWIAGAPLADGMLSGGNVQVH